MLTRFLIEWAIIIIIFLVLKKYWSEKVQFWFGHVVVGFQVVAIFLYAAGAFTGHFRWIDAWPKIIMHSVVALIIWTLFNIQRFHK